jgi:hypothetical protein
VLKVFHAAWVRCWFPVTLVSGLLFALGGEHHRTDLLSWWAGGWLQSRTPRRTSRLVALKHNFRLTGPLRSPLSSPVSRPGYCVWSPIRPRGLIPLHASIRLVGWRFATRQTPRRHEPIDVARGTGCRSNQPRTPTLAPRPEPKRKICQRRVVAALKRAHLLRSGGTEEGREGKKQK